jgi:hypothetical protein
MGEVKPRFTPTQQRMIDVLSDGMPHTREELHKCLWDEEGALGNIKMHISLIRKVLQPVGQDIVCCLVRGTIQYRHIRRIYPSSEGMV